MPVRLQSPSHPFCAVRASGLADLQARAPCFTFTDSAARELAVFALTHSSLSASRNNVELARVGEASGRLAATKAIYRRPDLHSGQAYDLYGWSRFATKNLAPIARHIGLQDLMRLGRGTAAVSDEMVARALLALIGVLELTAGSDAVHDAVVDLGIVALPAAQPQDDNDDVYGRDYRDFRQEPDTLCSANSAS